MRYLLLVVAIILLAVFGASYLVFNLQKEKTKEAMATLSSEEQTCLSLMTKHDSSISTASLKEYFADKHIDSSDGSNVKWKVGFLGEEVVNRTFVDTIPLNTKIVFFVSSNSFEGCGIRENKRDTFTSDHYLCKNRPFEYFITSSTDNYFLRFSSGVVNGSLPIDFTYYLTEPYYNKILDSLNKRIEEYACEKV